MSAPSGKIGVSDPGAGDLKVYSHSGKYLLRSDTGFHLHEPYGIDYHPWTKETVVVDKMFSCVYVHGPSGVVKDMITKHGVREAGEDEEDERAPLSQPNYVSFDYAGTCTVFMVPVNIMVSVTSFTLYLRLVNVHVRGHAVWLIILLLLSREHLRH